MSLLLRGEAATEAAGRRLGGRLAPGDLVLLDGDLGAGKTTLVRGMAAALGVTPGEVRSPTFVLHHVYRGTTLTLHHLDAWRLGPGDALADEVDLEGLLDGAAVVVEWGGLLAHPGEPALHARIDVPAADSRELHVLRGRGPLRAALEGVGT